MKNYVKIALVIVNIASFGLKLPGQTPTITSPVSTSSATVVNKSQQTIGIQLVAQASGGCMTFDWTDQFGGDWGAGNTSVSADGTTTTSTLTYFPPGYAYGTQITMSVKAKDTSSSSSSWSAPAMINLIVPLITGSLGATDLSYYGGTLYGTNTGGPATSLRVEILPVPSSTKTTYTWGAVGGAIDVDSNINNQDYCVVDSYGASQNASDQDLQLLGPDGSEATDLPLTVHCPQSTGVSGVVYQPLQAYLSDGLVNENGELTYIWYKGWNTFYTMNVWDSIGAGKAMPNGTPVYEIIDSYSNLFQWAASSASFPPSQFFVNSTGQFTDTYQIAPSVTWVTQPVWQNDPGASALEFYARQQYVGGPQMADPGNEPIIDVHAMNFFRGNASQTSW